MLRITMPSLPPQSYDKQTLSESFTLEFPWKEQPLAKEPPCCRGGIQQHSQSWIPTHAVKGGSILISPLLPDTTKLLRKSQKGSSWNNRQLCLSYSSNIKLFSGFLPHTHFCHSEFSFLFCRGHTEKPFSPSLAEPQHLGKRNLKSLKGAEAPSLAEAETLVTRLFPCFQRKPASSGWD